MEIPRHWRLKEQRYNLVGEKCENNHHVFPPRDICPDCHGDATTPYTMSGKGEVYSHTTVYEAPAGHEGNIPYVVALVKLDEGPMITAQLTDLTTHIETKIIDGEEEETRVFDVEIGMPVEMVTKKLKDNKDERGVIVYGYKFRPAFSSSI